MKNNIPYFSELSSFKSISNELIISPGSKEAETDEDDPEDDADLANAAKDDDLQKQRKKAGLPELVLDSLPSASCNRMMILFLKTRQPSLFIGHSTGSYPENFNSWDCSS